MFKYRFLGPPEHSTLVTVSPPTCEETQGSLQTVLNDKRDSFVKE
jgi:hypothetical protein